MWAVPVMTEIAAEVKTMDVTLTASPCGSNDIIPKILYEYFYQRIFKILSQNAAFN